MFHKILPNDPIFKSPALLKDALPFNIIFTIIPISKEYPELKIFSTKDKDCLILNSDPKHPIIVWTADNFKVQNFQELLNFVMKEFSENNPLEISSKQEFYDFVKTTGYII